jgi:O-antigen ligase
MSLSTRKPSDFPRPARLGTPQHVGLYVFLLLILAWAPIPIGSNRGWSLAILEAGLALWLAYPLIQLIPLSANAIEFVGEGVGTLYLELPPDIASDTAYLTHDRNATFSGFIRNCSMLALFFSVLALTTSTSRLRGLLALVLVVGFIEALYGLLLYVGGDELGLWSPGQAQVTISGTYVNQNHFAGLLEITIPVGLGLLLSEWPKSEEFSEEKSIVHSVLTFVHGQRAVILFCVLVMTAALIMTASRGGVGALAVGVTVAVSIAVWRKGVRARELVLGMMAVALAGIAIFWFGFGQFSEKLQTAGFSSDRGDLREISYRIVSDNPLLGTGLGTYRWVFPSYKDERFGSYFYEHAHNDFLEMLSEQGIIGFSLLAVGLSLIFVRVVWAYGRRRDPLIQGTLFATIAGCVSLMVHGLVDFNFHIPANASYFFTLLGLGAVASSLRVNPGNE